ncbi:hypothetical protein FACS1894201_00740 [Bacteroidia bacterium]|nr:hypothetical protein FACS1894201_00740 [Bacteroidia bacterium]
MKQSYKTILNLNNRCNVKHTLLIDLHSLKNAYCGLWTFTCEFGNELIRQIDFDKWDVTFLVPENHPFTSDKVHYKTLKWWHRFTSLLWRYDVVHATAQNSPYIRRKNRHTKYVVTIHDLNFLYEKRSFKMQRYLSKYQHNIKGIDHIVCISWFTEQDVLQYLQIGKSKHSVIYHGLTLPGGSSSLAAGSVAESIKDKPYLFDISTIMRKKNILILVEMMRFLPDMNLVVAGKVVHQDYYEEIVQAIAMYELKDRVLMLGSVTEEEKWWLYEHCTAFVFPSLAEGFGLPPLDAMQVGKPVFASRSTSIPEICGEMAFYWDILEGQAMAQVVQSNLANTTAPQCNAKLLKAYTQKYNWNRCINQYMDVYEKLLK